MLRHIHVSALMLGLVLAAPAVAEGQSTARRPAALIDINALTAESDFTVFMRKDVPEDVSRSALRKLWTLLQLPASCDELCYLSDPAAPGFARLASEKLAVAAQ